MPTYDYVCTACGHRLEVVHGIHGHHHDPCPVCGGTMRKAFTAPTVHFKGSGWAKKDRGAAASTKAAARSGGTDGDTGSTKHEGDQGEPKPTSDKNPGDKAASDSGSSDSGSSDSGSSATESKSPTPKTPAGAD